jgi:predicted RND superfamily exporter protein
VALTAASSGAESVLRLGLKGWVGYLATGRNVVCVDLDDRIADRLPVFVGLVVLVALVILGAVFRSLAVPSKPRCST